MSSSQTKKAFSPECPRTKNIAAEPSSVDDNTSITPARRPGRTKTKNITPKPSSIDNNASITPAKYPEHLRIKNSKNTTENSPISPNTFATPNILIKPPITKNIVTKNISTDDTITLDYDTQLDHANNHHATHITQHDYDTHHAIQVTQCDHTNAQFNRATQITQRDYARLDYDVQLDQ